MGMNQGQRSAEGREQVKADYGRFEGQYLVNHWRSCWRNSTGIGLCPPDELAAAVGEPLICNQGNTILRNCNVDKAKLMKVVSKMLEA